jgi:ribonuclease VapC
MNVFDASALLAVLGAEPGADKVSDLLDQPGGVASSVNFAEVLTKLIDRGLSPDAALQAWRGLNVPVAPADETLAIAAASLRSATRRLGLSLGDRCCLALAQELGARVVTADKPWAKLQDFEIVLVR